MVAPFRAFFPLLFMTLPGLCTSWVVAFAPKSTRRKSSNWPYTRIGNNIFTIPSLTANKDDYYVEIANGGKNTTITAGPEEKEITGKLIGSSAERTGETRSPARNLYEYAKAAAGTLGDIMSTVNDNVATSSQQSTDSASLNKRDGLVTTAIASGSLASRFGIIHPLDRMALTANGNLQRLVSSYYDAPVQVLVDSCTLKDPYEKCQELPSALRKNGTTSTKMWDRVVHLTVHNQTFCTAHSTITVYDPTCQQLVESGEVGLGQLFRYLDILPEFELHDAAPYPAETGGGFWREYSLKCAELSCHIHEDFRSDIWNIRPPT